MKQAPAQGQKKDKGKGKDKQEVDDGHKGGENPVEAVQERIGDKKVNVRLPVKKPS